MIKSIYIGNGFTDGQLLYVIPFVDGYAREKKIKKLVFGNPLSKKVKLHSLTANILSRYIVEEKGHKGFQKYFPLYFHLVLSFRLSLKLALNSTRQGLLENVSWYESQLRHAVWDQTLQGVRDGLLELPFMMRLIAAMRVLLTVKRAQNLYNNDGVEAAVLGHTVYAGRALLATFRLKNIDIIAHAGNVLHRTFGHSDVGYLTMSHSEWEILCSMVDQFRVDNYWSERMKGKSSYSDAERAANSKKTTSSQTPKNIIFLHIFRDSPFNHIDRLRIFSDYVQWVMETLRFLSESDAQWLVKIHPSALRWGEGQMVWLRSIGRNVFGDSWPEHIKIDNMEYSNIDLLANAKRIVTYRGTVHLEAACLGIKPIVISEVSLSSFNRNLVHKPTSVSEYKNLLLCHEDSNSFRLTEEQQKDAKRLLFIREEVLSFTRDVGAFNIYRGDSQSLFNKYFESISKNANNFSPILTEIGGAFAKGLPRSVRFDYFKKWANLYQATIEADK